MQKTTIYRVAEQAQRIIAGGDVSADVSKNVSIQELMIFVRQSFAALVKLSFFENKNEGESYVDGGFIYSFENVSVTKDNNKDMYYSDMPSATIVLPHEIQVYQISPMQSQGEYFIPLRNGFHSLMQGLAVGELEGDIGYFIEGNRVYYTFKPSNKIDKVLMKLVVAIDNVGDEESIVMPADMQMQIVQRAVELYSAQKAAPKDVINDNNK